ncbi:hypothetical protein LBMAG27_22090 [Bacteroidota bacterium]|nr:hypothetical protein LBMAG27_22090 [Bacteroidota bacterium]
MLKEQEDTNNMYGTVEQVLDDNTTIYTANVPFKTAVAAFKTNNAKIETLREQQETDNKGITQDKKEKRDKLETESIKIGSVVSFFAAQTGNNGLRQKVNFNKSELARARDNEVTGMAEQVYNAANDNAAALVAYGITAGMITDYRDLIDAYSALVSAPRTARTETSAATKQLPPLFDANNLLLTEQLDMGMELYSTSDPGFFNSYQGARVIVNSPTRKRALQLTALDSVTNLPVEHVLVTVDSNAITRHTSIAGRIYVQNLTEGTHNLRAQLVGYTLYETPFNVISGETTEVEVKLVKE